MRPRSAVSQDPLLGQTLGGSLIESKLAEGGMGVVYRAYQPRLGRRVAVKVLKATIAADVELVKRFGIEARAAAQLEHPNIVVIHQVGDAEASPFIVMQLLDGESLDKVIRKGGGMTAADAIKIARQVAAALDYAHTRRVIH